MTASMLATACAVVTMFIQAATPVTEPVTLFPGAELALPSPDTTYIATIPNSDSTDICIVERASDAETCVTTGRRSVEYTNISWSPDSSTLLYGEDSMISGLDADIWTIDASTGELTNRTDDDTDVFDDASAFQDRFPGWTLDSEIVFQRMTADGMTMQRLSLDTGEPETIVAFPPRFAAPLGAPAHRLTDGSLLLSTSELEGVTTGIVRIGADGTWGHVAAHDALAGQQSIVVLDVTADGQTAIVYGRAAYESRFHDGALALMHLFTGEITRPAAMEFTPLVPATFTTNDEAVLLAVPQDDGSVSIQAMAIDSGVVTEFAVLPAPTDGTPDAMFPLRTLLQHDNGSISIHSMAPPISVLLPPPD